MDNNSIFIENLKRHINRYSPGQRKIAEYVLGNLHAAAFKTGKELAEASGVSEATISRFVGRLGYSHYSVYQKELQLQVMSEFKGDKRFKKALPGQDQEETSLTKFIRQELENISDLQRNFQPEEFKRAVSGIRGAEKIMIIGVRGAAALAQRLYFGLYKIRLDATIMNKISAETFEDVDRLTSRDLIIAIAFPRYLSSMVKLLKNAKSRNIKVLTITDNEFSLIQGDINLYCPAKNTTFISNHCAPLILVTALVHEVSVRDSDGTLHALEVFENLVEKNEFFARPD